MQQWVGEFHTWWPPLRVTILHESGSFQGSKSSLIQVKAQRQAIVILKNSPKYYFTCILVMTSYGFSLTVTATEIREREKDCGIRFNIYHSFTLKQVYLFHLSVSVDFLNLFYHGHQHLRTYFKVRLTFKKFCFSQRHNRRASSLPVTVAS